MIIRTHALNLMASLQYEDSPILSQKYFVTDNVSFYPNQCWAQWAELVKILENYIDLKSLFASIQERKIVSVVH